MSSIFEDVKKHSVGSLPSMNYEVENALTENLPALPDADNKDEWNDEIFQKILSDLNQPSFAIDPCTKTRGETYLVEDKRLTAKKGQWIPISMSGIVVHQHVRLSLRYEDVSFQATTPVICQHNCAVTTPNLVGSNLGDIAFCVRFGSNIYLPAPGPGLHPSVVFHYNESPMHVLFRCWNSCDSHKKFNKNRILVLEVLETKNGIMETVYEQRFSLRVCESIKRDHGLPSGSVLKKRKLSSAEMSPGIKREVPESTTCVLEINAEGNNSSIQNLYGSKDHFMSDLVPVKKEPLFPVKREPLVPMKREPQATTATQEGSFSPKTFIVKMKSEGDEELLKSLVERLDGDYRYM